LEKQIQWVLREITADYGIGFGEHSEKLVASKKKLYNHFKAFNLAFFYINFGYV
jgi:hypothetical protein